MIPQTEFYQAINVVIRHAATDQSNPPMPHLENILIEFLADNTLRFVGTDGHRLAMVDLAVVHGQPVDTSFLLARGHAERLNTRGQISIYVFGDDIMFTDGTTVESFPRAVAEYPDYRAVLQKDSEPAKCLRFDPLFFIDALAVCQPFMTDFQLEFNHGIDPVYLRPRISKDYTSIKRVEIAIMLRGQK